MAMSSSVARKRRSEVQQPTQMSYNPNPNVSPQQQQSQQQLPQQPSSVQTQQRPMGTGMTLPQVISVIDNRLVVLENFMRDTKVESNKTIESQSAELPSDFIEEVQERFDILAREISDLKDVILKLQSFTMDVNKSLLEERINILSDLGDNKEEV